MMPSPNSRDSPYEHFMSRSANNQLHESFATQHVTPPPAQTAQYTAGPVTLKYHGSSEPQANDHQPTITQMTKAELRKVIIS